MANVSHASLTGSQLHEPKGASTAALGEVYVADGTGSGNWANVGTSSFTGMIADFPTPVAPSGWLECDGSVVSTTTYSALYDVMTVQTTGTRINGSPIITSIASTTNMRAGYYVFGTGFNTGLTIVSVDSANQITLSGNAISGGTAAIAVSPWLLNTGTIKLPDVTTLGRYRRSRTSSTAIGQVQADQNKAHTHLVAGSTGAGSAHSHNVSGTTGTQSASHTHGFTAAFTTGQQTDLTPGSVIGAANSGSATGVESANHTHSMNFTSGTEAAHTHSMSFTSGSDGGAEVRPLSIVLMTCVKT